VDSGGVLRVLRIKLKELRRLREEDLPSGMFCYIALRDIQLRIRREILLIISIIYISKVRLTWRAPPKNQLLTFEIDIARIAALGVKTYSFSISWSRVFPFGNGPINELALAHYDDVINTCIEYGVEPSVTLYHWDLPLNLQNTYGGWLGPQIVDDFVNYAQVVFSRYGNKVTRWFTVNEPIVFW
jgi:hypothetical protein